MAMSGQLPTLGKIITTTMDGRIISVQTTTPISQQQGTKIPDGSTISLGSSSIFQVGSGTTEAAAAGEASKVQVTADGNKVIHLQTLSGGSTTQRIILPSSGGITAMTAIQPQVQHPLAVGITTTKTTTQQQQVVVAAGTTATAAPAVAVGSSHETLGTQIQIISLPDGQLQEEYKKPCEYIAFNQHHLQGFQAKPMHQVVWNQKPKPKPVIDPSATKCFCGISGNWYDRMLECQRCKRWFHETCVCCLVYKLICGDRFYLYVCEFCNSGREFLHRLNINWENIVHLALWNLSYSKHRNGKYFEYEQIALWVNNHWELLQCPPELQSIPLRDRTQYILSTLQGNSYKFKCGKEVKKKTSIWALRTVTDLPSVFEIILPPEIPITEASMHRISYCVRTTALTPIPKTFKVDAAEPVMRMYMKPQVGPPRVLNIDNEDDNKSAPMPPIQRSQKPSAPLTPLPPPIATPLLEMGFSMKHIQKAIAAQGHKGEPSTSHINQLVTWMIDHPSIDSSTSTAPTWASTITTAPTERCRLAEDTSDIAATAVAAIIISLDTDDDDSVDEDDDDDDDDDDDNDDTDYDDDMDTTYGDTAIKKWIVINYNDEITKDDLLTFLQTLKAAGADYGLTISNPLKIRNSQYECEPEQEFPKLVARYPNLQMIMCVLRGYEFDDVLYDRVKDVEASLNIVTKCVMATSVLNRAKRTIKNMVVKIDERIRTHDMKGKQSTNNDEDDTDDDDADNTEYGDDDDDDDDDMDTTYNDTVVNRWVVLNYNDLIDRVQILTFLQVLKAAGAVHGLTITSPLEIQDSLICQPEQEFPKLKDKYPDLQMIMCIMRGWNYDDVLYDHVKDVGDASLNIVTKCVMANSVLKRPKRTINNMVIKIDERIRTHAMRGKQLPKNMKAEIKSEPIVLAKAEIKSEPVPSVYHPEMAITVKEELVKSEDKLIISELPHVKEEPQDADDLPLSDRKRVKEESDYNYFPLASRKKAKAEPKKEEDKDEDFKPMKVVIKSEPVESAYVPELASAVKGELVKSEDTLVIQKPPPIKEEPQDENDFLPNYY